MNLCFFGFSHVCISGEPGKRRCFTDPVLRNNYTPGGPQNNGLEKVTPFQIWQFLVSMLDFWGVPYQPYHVARRPLFVCWVLAAESHLVFLFSAPP